MKTPAASQDTDPQLSPLLRQMPEAYRYWEKNTRDPRLKRIEKRIAQLLATGGTAPRHSAD